MNEQYGEWYQDLQQVFDLLSGNQLYAGMEQLVNSGRATLSMNRKLMEKTIDVSWVEAIENGIIHVDNVVRNPSRTIVDVEEVVPIALSKKITVESVKHLAQHTDLIQSVDPVTGKITPSKILNVHKEESLATYENRFVNTLIDRLYIFIMTRYEKLAEVERDEELLGMEFTNEIEGDGGNSMQITLSIDARKNLATTNDSGYTLWQRVEKLKKTIEGYKGSELCTTLGNNYVRPPIMRTNAIMKNVDLKACLTLWQYILGYDKVGYEISVDDSALKPHKGFIKDLNQMMAANLMLFRSYTGGETPMRPLEKKNYKVTPPKIVKRYKPELLSGHYDLHADEAVGYIAEEGAQAFVNPIPEDSDDIFEQINKVIEIEKNFYADREEKRLAQIAAEEEAQRRREEREARLEEKRRIEEARKAERERIAKEKEEERRRIEEMLERRKAEIEAQRIEAERLEAERQARLEEERKAAEERARIEAENARIEANRSSIRSEFGEAEGVDTAVFDKMKEFRDKTDAYSTVKTEDIEEAQAAIEEEIAQNPESQEEKKEIYEDPREVAARMKLAQQKKEKEDRAKRRALELREKRRMYEQTPFKEIYKRYTYNPIYAIPRLILWILYKLFGYIPHDTDNPDQIKILARRAERIAADEKIKAERDKFMVYYKKYATNFPYNIERFIQDMKFKRKKKKADAKKPKPVFVPVKRTPEEQRAIDMQMRTLYKTYHVGLIETIRRKMKEYSREERERQRKMAYGE